jgi:GT2 family glycosyltransferase
LTYPLVSILWLNYNSAPFIETSLESLQSIKDLEYTNYELIVVDNGSTDESFTIIGEAIKKMNIKSKIIKLESNLGFTGGNNVAYKARNLSSKYVVLLNNDASPHPESLTNLVDVMENDGTLGSAQGIVLSYDGRSIDTAGGFDSELLTSYLFLSGREPGALNREIYVSHTNGAYAVYRVAAVEKVMGYQNEILDHELFSLREDDLIGFRLWNAGFKVKVFPFITGKHKRGSSVRRIEVRRIYLLLRNWLVLNEISNSRYKSLVEFMITRCGFTLSASLRLSRKKRMGSEANASVFLKTVQRAVADGKRIGRKKKAFSGLIDIYKAPIIKVRPSVAVPGIVAPIRLVHRDVSKVLDKIATGELQELKS